MTKQVPYMQALTLTGADQQVTDPTLVPPAAALPASETGEGVPQNALRAVSKLFQELEFRTPPGNAAAVQIGVIINGVIVYGISLKAGDARKWSRADLLNVPLDLIDFHFKGTAADVLLINGLPNRQ